MGLMNSSSHCTLYTSKQRRLLTSATLTFFSSEFFWENRDLNLGLLGPEASMLTMSYTAPLLPPPFHGSVSWSFLWPWGFEPVSLGHEWLNHSSHDSGTTLNLLYCKVAQGNPKVIRMLAGRHSGLNLTARAKNLSHRDAISRNDDLEKQSNLGHNFWFWKMGQFWGEKEETERLQFP